MATKCRNLKFVALDIDGVLLKDTFSPVIRLFVEKHGGTYDEDFEENVFSRPRKQAAEYLLQRLKLTLSPAEIEAEFFALRKTYIQEHGGGLLPGVAALLKRLQDADLKLLCYGGLDFKYFSEELRDHLAAFSGDKYICTNDFRPGVKEVIAKAKCAPQEVLFVDDVDYVAQYCKAEKIPFLGMPSTPIQRQLMRKTGVRNFIERLDDLNGTLLVGIDHKSKIDGGWVAPPPPM